MVSGMKSETKLRTEDSLTSSKIFERIHAISVARILKNKTEALVTSRNCLSENLCPMSGFMRFSEKIAAGAKIAELVVLIMADSKEPKNKI